VKRLADVILIQIVIDGLAILINLEDVLAFSGFMQHALGADAHAGERDFLVRGVVGEDPRRATTASRPAATMSNIVFFIVIFGFLLSRLRQCYPVSIQAKIKAKYGRVKVPQYPDLIVGTTQGVLTRRLVTRRLQIRTTQVPLGWSANSAAMTNWNSGIRFSVSTSLPARMLFNRNPYSKLR